MQAAFQSLRFILIDKNLCKNCKRFIKQFKHTTKPTFTPNTIFLQYKV